MLESGIAEEIMELSCHPGYTDAAFESPYNIEREIEPRTLSDDRSIAFLHERVVELMQPL
jgi:predicted glycoside hydrolase/deacetylase ChbG (UPF0249 family)